MLLARVLQLVHEVDDRAIPYSAQPCFETGRATRTESGDQGAEDPQFIGAGSDPDGLGPSGLSRGELAEIVAAVPVDVPSGEPDGRDRPQPDGGRALQA